MLLLVEHLKVSSQCLCGLGKETIVNQAVSVKQVLCAMQTGITNNKKSLETFCLDSRANYTNKIKKLLSKNKILNLDIFV